MHQKRARSNVSVLKQPLNFIPRSLLNQTARKTGVDAKARTFSVLSHVAPMFYAQLSHAIRRVEFSRFKEVAKELVMEKFQLGLRHDIRTPEGRQTHGWKHLSLVPDFPVQVPDAA